MGPGSAQRPLLRGLPDAVPGALPPGRPLPRWITTFVGRQPEVEALEASLGDHRLVTLLGAGGSGKTRLAAAVAEQVADRFQVHLVELAPVPGGHAVAATVLGALGVGDPSASAADALASAIGDRRVLLLLDNCEHVRGDTATLVHHLLSACPGLSVLATSREPLGVTGELRWDVPPLASPPANGWLPTKGALRHDAVRLFVDRARLVSPGFELTDQNAALVAELCRLVDGLPLAIELLAGRLPVLGLHGILERLTRGRRLPAGTDPTAEPRHADLDALLEWSYELLREGERALLRGLSVFAGSADLDAVEQVCAGGDLEVDEVLGLLAALVERSLVVAEDRDGQVHYRLLRTVQRFAAARAEAAGETDLLRRRHLDWLLATHAPHHRGLFGPTASSWARTVASAATELNAAIRWAADAAPADGLALAWWLHTGTALSGMAADPELPALLGSLVERTASEPPSGDRGRALLVLAELAEQDGRFDRAREIYDEVTAIAGHLGDDDLLADVLWFLGDHHVEQGDLARATEHYERARDLLVELADPYRERVVVVGAAYVALMGGDADVASVRAEEVVAIARGCDDPVGMAVGSRVLAVAAREAGQPDLARELLAEALDHARTAEDRAQAAKCLVDLAELATEPGTAAEMASEALRVPCVPQVKGLRDRCLQVLAEVALGDGDASRAALLLGAGASLADTGLCHYVPSPGLLAELRRRRDRIAADATRSLGAAAYAETYELGTTLPLEAVVQQGLVEVGDLLAIPTPPSAAPVGASLRLDGADWEVSFSGRTVRARDAKGIRYLSRLLSEPGREFHVLDLATDHSVGAPAVDPGMSIEAGHAGELLDPIAKETYRRRLNDLAEDLEEATDLGDAERASRAQEEIDAITQELAAAFGLGGRARRAADAGERARKAVSKCLRDTIRKLIDLHPELGRHLENSVRTGTFCSYRPEHAVEWSS